MACCLFLISFGIIGHAQNFNSVVKADIVVNDLKDDLLEVTGTAQNLTGASYSLRYELSVITSSPGSDNHSRNSQTGRFTLGPHDTNNLSRTTVSIHPDKRTIILLLIYNLDDELMGTSRRVYDKQEERKALEELSYEKQNEGIQLVGMVTERTKTKPGKDFYDIFYQKYHLSPTQGNRIVKIDEIISFGRTTRIRISVEDQLVYQFIAQPKRDYLMAHADEGLRRVQRYFQYLENRNESDIKY